MDLVDFWNIIKIKLFRDKNNIYIILQFILGIVLLLISLNFKYNFLNMVNNVFSQNIGFRSLSVTQNNDEDGGKEKLASIEHVISVYSSEYDNYVVDSSFKTFSLDGEINLLYGDQNVMPNITNGRAISKEDRNVAICPEKFYPSSKAYDLFINEKEILNGNELLDQNFKIIYYSYKYDNGEMIKDQEYTKEFKVIGIYDASKNINTANSCYISSEDMIEIKNIDKNENGDLSYNFVVVVDSLENIFSVQQQIIDLGFLDASIRSEYDKKVINTILISCDLVVTIIIFGVLLLTISYIKKKKIYDSKFYELLRCIGFTNNNVKKINVGEQLVIDLISYGIGVIAFSLLFLLIKCFIIKKYIMFASVIGLFWQSFLITFIFIFIVTIIGNIVFMLQNKKNISMTR